MENPHESGTLPPVPEPVEGHTDNLTNPALLLPVPEPVEGHTENLTSPAPVLRSLSLSKGT
ncbi:hypothetical protein BWO91_10075 [Plantibacter flavus]|nr:hypothetical protein BWO91_10075 [Plantibacter flavus]